MPPRRRGNGFTQSDLLTYLGIGCETLKRLMRAAGVPKSDRLLTREEAGRIIMERRRRQGARLRRQASHAIKHVGGRP